MTPIRIQVAEKSLPSKILAPEVIPKDVTNERLEVEGSDADVNHLGSRVNYTQEHINKMRWSVMDHTVQTMVSEAVTFDHNLLLSLLASRLVAQENMPSPYSNGYVLLDPYSYAGPLRIRTLGVVQASCAHQTCPKESCCSPLPPSISGGSPGISP